MKTVAIDFIVRDMRTHSDSYHKIVDDYDDDFEVEKSACNLIKEYIDKSRLPNGKYFFYIDSIHIDYI